MEPEIIDERDGSTADRGRYVLLVDGLPAGELTWHGTADRRTMSHTFIDPDHRGSGLASLLVERALADARSDGVLVRPTCSYVADHIARHPEHRDLLVP